MKPLLVGEMPSRSGDRYWQFPLSGAVAQTLCQLAEVPPQDEGSRYGRFTWALYDAFDCVNAVERHGPWDSEKAADHLVDVLSRASEEYEVVVLLGRRPQSAYARMAYPGESVVKGIDFFDWVVDPISPTGRREVVVLPHPSSLNQSLHQSRFMQWRTGLALQAAIARSKQLHETRL